MKQKSSRFCSHNPWRSTIVAFIVIARGSLESANLNDERNQPCSSHTEQQREILLCECINYYPRPFVTLFLSHLSAITSDPWTTLLEKTNVVSHIGPNQLLSFLLLFLPIFKTRHTSFVSELCCLRFFHPFGDQEINGLKKSIYFG